jgi:HK97 family phage portal protein
MRRSVLPRKRFGPSRPEPAAARSMGSGLGTWEMYGYTGAVAPPHAQAPQINSRNAVTIAAVLQAFQVYIGAISPLDFYIARKGKEGGWSPAYDNPLYDLIHSRPNPETTAFNFRSTILYHALSTGNGLAEIERGDKGRPKALWNLDPSTKAVRHSDGTLWFRGPDLDEDLPARDVIHLRGIISWNAITGFNPIDVARDTLRLIRARDVYELALMDNGAAPRGHFEWFGDIDAVAADQHLADWNRHMRGPQNAGKTANIRNGKWVQDQLSPVDAEIAETRNQGVYDVARIFNLPPHKLGLLENASYSTVAEQNLEFYTVSCLPYITSIEQEWSYKLLSARERKEFSIKHNPASILRLNPPAQAERDRSLFGMGALSINEIRLSHGLPPLDEPEASYHWIPVNNLQAIEVMADLPAGSLQAQDPGDVSEDPTETNPSDATETPPRAPIKSRSDPRWPPNATLRPRSARSTIARPWRTAGATSSAMRRSSIRPLRSSPIRT